MPKPKTGENKEEYLQRCMADSEMNTELPETDQRYAVCISYWDESKMSALDKYVKLERNGKA